ncbi:MAG: N-acetyltransferase [Spirochaetales bacterium]|nr:N-acetyltransferase [Spirochaetales bacterium]
MNIHIRHEKDQDFRTVEELTREAFWDVHVSGCDEHYLVHEMRQHPDFIQELDFVAELNGKIVGSIMYTKAWLINENQDSRDVLCFGPVSVLPEFQKMGIGSALIRHSLKIAAEMGHKLIVIYGHPHYYCKLGFVGSKSLNIADTTGKFPYALLALELEKGWLKKQSWKIKHSDVYDVDAQRAMDFDKTFLPKEKGFRSSQEEFRIACSAYLE